MNYPTKFDKDQALRVLDTMTEQIREERPFKLTFEAGGHHWTAFIPEVVTTPTGKVFTMTHQLVRGERV